MSRPTCTSFGAIIRWIRTPQGKATPVGGMILFVPGPLRNPTNGSRGPWQKHARWARQWRERTCATVLATHGRGNMVAARQPKRVSFVAHTWNRFDTDGLAAALKPVRDGLVDAGILSGDGPSSGHVFLYDQVLDRRRRGVRIVVEAR